MATPNFKVYGFALIEPQMNICIDMLKYAKDVYAQGAEPLPDMVKLMVDVIDEINRQVKDQPAIKPEKRTGLINE